MGKAKLVSKNGLLVSVLVFVATTAAILVLSSRFIAAPHFLLVQSVCHHPAPLIGPRVWQTIEADVIPRGSKDWDRVGILFDQWNNGNLQIDESHFYENRPEVWGQTGARQPGYAWFKFVTDPKDQKPVAFVPRAPPARVLLPWCERTVEKHIEKNPASDVSVCIIVRNEERALREWINYYLFLGVGRIAVYDDMSVDRTSEIARAYGDAVSYMKWEPSPKGWEIDQMDMYLDCASKERDRGAKWVGNLDVDEYLVFDDPNQKVDSFLHAFDRHHPNVGSVSFNWRMMSSDEVSLPDPAFTVLDVQYACSDRSDERHHVKTFVKLEAFRGVENPHFQLLKEGFRQYDVSGGIIDPPGPFASRSIPSPARINHYRLLSLHEWLRKASKRHSRIGGTLAVTDNSTSHAKRLGDYGYEHLEITLGNCFPTQPDGLALLNVLARQGCL